jgi:ABC-type branched-subunit amino acid transport system substrate-binding protein
MLVKSDIRRAALRIVAGLIGLASGVAAAAEILIAQVAPLSGPLAPTGNGMRVGALVCFEAINAAGGIRGSKIRLASRDDGYKAEETVRLARATLAESRPLAFFGIVGTGNLDALIKESVMSEAGIPAIGLRSGASSLVRPENTLLFFTRASYAEEVERIVSHLSLTGQKRIGAFYQDDAFGADGLAAIDESAKRHAVEVVARASYAKNTTQVEASVKTLGASKAQAIVMVANTAASAEFLKQYRSGGGTAQLFALSTTEGPQVAEKIGAKTAHGFAVSQVVPDPLNRGVPIVRDFQNDFQKYAPAGSQLSATILEGYVAARVLVEGLRRAGAEPTRARLTASLQALRNFDVGGMIIGFDSPSRSGSRYVDIAILGGDGKLLR